MERKTILTGDRPTGKLHLGHYAGSLRNRVELQNSGKYDMYVFIADMQALTDNAKNPQKIRDNIIEVALDYLSVGLDPEKTCIFVQSQIPALSELTMYYMNLVSLARLKRNPTIKSEIKERGFGETIPVGFLTYPISQAADITAFDADLVPVGEDQAPILEQDIEIVRTFNSIYGKTLKEPKQLTPENVCKRLPGIDGKNKMSKSLGNCIYLSDTPEEVTKKVMTMYTDPNHIRVEDPGDTKNNPVFMYLEAFSTDEHFAKYLPEFKNLEDLKTHYEQGGVGDVKIKKFLANVLNDILTPIRERRAIYENNIEAVYKMLEEGSKKARAKSEEVLTRVRKAIGVEYFK
ncbi:MAG: tryptophan--tRNA ligase [Tenericutes bacterium]|nr:tryptophan--tRNA ligase [Mycoplasmatota bacterium]